MKKDLLNISFIKEFLKTNRIAYNLYYLFGNICLRFVGFFLKTDPHLILFVSFGGKRFDDSPKEIYECMINKEQTAHLKYHWAFVEPDVIEIPYGKKIKIDSIAYFRIALKSRIWVTNSEIGRGLKFKKKKTFCLNTWHGTPIKKIGFDANNVDSGFGSKDASNADVMLAQGVYDADIFSRVFNIDRDKVKVFGLPRNDILVNSSSKSKSEIKYKLGISNDKNVIFYAPTYREFDKDTNLKSTISPPINFKIWQKNLMDKYVIIFRAHYETAKILNIDFGHYKGFLYNMTDYSNLNELMLVSDVLISDYSSIFFDYSILGRPMFCFAYDYKRFIENRGLYIDIRNELPKGFAATEIQLLSKIKKMDIQEMCCEALKFRDKYLQCYGKATELSVNEIVYELIKGRGINK